MQVEEEELDDFGFLKQTPAEKQEELDKAYAMMNDTPVMPVIHLDEGKSRVDLLPVWSLLEAGRVMQYGTVKYGEHNWSMHAGRWAWTKLIGSALRHVFAWMRREDFDKESGLPHLAHAIVNLMMLLDLQSAKKGADDRNPLYKESA